MSELLKNSTVDTFIRLLDDDKHRWKLIELIPNAETLVKFVTKYKDKQHDIMSALFERGRIDAFKKIIHIYFNKNTEQNKRLRREFITSHAKDVPAKDYHYFFQYFKPEHKQKIAAMLTPDKKTKEKILQFPLVEYTPSEETSKKLEFYNALNKAYTEALPQAAPATKAQNTSYCSQNGIAGYLDENNQYQETYPLIKLVKISEIKKEKEEETEKEETEEQKNFSYTILEAQVPYSPNKHNLAREVFKSIPFPEFWMEDDLKTGKGYFNFLNELDKTYHNARECDSSFFILFKNFNINQNTIILDNIVDPTRKTNGLYNGYYSAYTTNQGDIGLVCSFPYDEIDIRHELTHNVGEFENTDIFHFILLLANKQNTISPERYTAIYEPYFIHPNKEFGRESLARIMQFKDFSQSPDPLLSATRSLFTIYADAKSNKQQAIINRIKLCANARVLGYKDFMDAYKYMNNYYLLCKADKQNPKKLETALNNFKKSYLKIVKKHCSKENPNFNSIEKYLIKCIKQEIKAIEQIKNHPLANQIILDVNTLSRDNITKNPPLEILVADTIDVNKRLHHARSKRRTPTELLNNLNTYIDVANQSFQVLQQEEKSEQPLNRNHYLDCVTAFCKTTVFANALIRRYNPKFCIDDNINIYIPDTLKMQNLNNAVYNLNLINSSNSDIRLSSEYMQKPFLPFKEAFQEAEVAYKKLQSKNKQEHIQNLRKSLQTLCHANPKGNPKEEIQNLRLLQLIYRELYPSAKKLPEELRFENLSYKDFEPIKDTSITALSELPTTKKDKQKEKLRKRRKKEKLEELREKYKDSKEKYEEIEREFKKSDEYKPLPSEEISPCAKIIRSNTRRLVNSEHFTQIILQSTRKTQTQSR